MPNLVTDEEIGELQDNLLNDATHAAAGEFEDHGIVLTTEELYQINDFLTQILNGRVPRR